MAHSTAGKQKAARGGKTRNQELKSKRAGQQQERLRQVLAQQKALEEKVATPVGKEEKKAVRTKAARMWRSDIQRRAGAALRITSQLGRLKGATDEDGLTTTARLQKELATLKTRL